MYILARSDQLYCCGHPYNILMPDIMLVAAEGNTEPVLFHVTIAKGSQKKPANYPHFVDKRLITPTTD